MNWNRTSLLGLEDLTVEEITMILELASEFKRNLQNKVLPSKNLKGKRIVNL